MTEALADQVARIVRSIRQLELKKSPSVSETIDWARTLVLLGIESVTEAEAADTINILLKYQSDIAKAVKELTDDKSGQRRAAGQSRSVTVTDTAEPQLSGRPMLELLAGFIRELREAGLPVSLTENLDAMEAVKHIPLEDREAFKYALAATLVKNNTHWRAFETVFEVYFSLRGREYTARPTSSTSCWRRPRTRTARRPRAWTACAARAAPATRCRPRSWPRCSTRPCSRATTR